MIKEEIVNRMNMMMPIDNLPDGDESLCVGRHRSIRHVLQYLLFTLSYAVYL